jgi:hypothetical protein
MPFRLPRCLRRLFAPLTWSSRDREMDREMGFHLESLRHQYIRSGMSEKEAARAARASATSGGSRSAATTFEPRGSSRI